MPERSHHTPKTGVPRRRQPKSAQPAPFPTLEPFARRLEGLRLDRGLTQRALAARAHISTNYYHDIAHAQANPTVIVLLSLADALGLPVADLFDSQSTDDATRRVVAAADLRDLAATHERLTTIVERLAR